MSINVKFRRRRAACLLLEGKRSKDVAAELKIRAETLSRWKKHPDFIREHERIREEMCEDMRGRLWQVATKAFETACESINGGMNERFRFDQAMQLFKTIKLEQVFTLSAAKTGTQTLIVEEKPILRDGPQKPIIQRISEIYDEIQETST